MFARDQPSRHMTVLAWAVLRDVIVDFSSVPTSFLPELAILFGDQSCPPLLSIPDLVLVFGSLVDLQTDDRAWFHNLPLWVFRFWTARVGHSPPASCRMAIRWIFPSVATEITWTGPMTAHGVAPSLQSLFVLPTLSDPLSLTVEIFWGRVFSLPWSTFIHSILKSFLQWCGLPYSGTKPILLARCLLCITWGTLRPLVPLPDIPTDPAVARSDLRWSFSKALSHHQVSFDELSSAPPEYLHELATSLNTVNTTRHDTIRDTWESMSSVEQLDPVHLHSASISIPSVSPILNEETQLLADGNLNFMSPLGENNSSAPALPQHLDFLRGGDGLDIPMSEYSSGWSGGSKVLQAAIQLAVSEVAIMSRDQRLLLMNREIDASAVGRILLVTFHSPTAPTKFTMNFYVCVEVLRQGFALPR